MNFCIVSIIQSSSPGSQPQINNRIRGRDPLISPLPLPLAAEKLDVYRITSFLNICISGPKTQQCGLQSASPPLKFCVFSRSKTAASFLRNLHSPFFIFLFLVGSSAALIIQVSVTNCFGMAQAYAFNNCFCFEINRLQKKCFPRMN